MKWTVSSTTHFRASLRCARRLCSIAVQIVSRIHPACLLCAPRFVRPANCADLLNQGQGVLLHVVRQEGRGVRAELLCARITPHSAGAELTVPCCADGVDHDFSDHECVFWRKVEGPLINHGRNGTNGPMEKVCRAANHV